MASLRRTTCRSSPLGDLLEPFRYRFELIGIGVAADHEFAIPTDGQQHIQNVLALQAPADQRGGGIQAASIFSVLIA